MKWTQPEDATLIEPYRPVPQLLASRVKKHPEIQKAIDERRMVTIGVRKGQFTSSVQGRGTVGQSVPIQGIPDLEVQVYQSEGAVLLALTNESRDQLRAICDGKETIAENLGVGEKQSSTSLLNAFPVGNQQSKHTVSRKELAAQFSVTENAIQNWCSICSIRSSLTEFDSVQVERLALYKRLSDAGISAKDIRAIFSNYS